MIIFILLFTGIILSPRRYASADHIHALFTPPPRPQSAHKSAGSGSSDKSRSTGLSLLSPVFLTVKKGRFCRKVCLLVGCLTSQQHEGVSQGRTCTDNFTCCHTEVEVADPTFYLTQSQYTDTELTSPSTDPITSGAWQDSHWSTNF